MENCVFCKIIKGELPSYKIYENQHVYAFLDIAPVVDGHTMVIPKVHAESLLDISDESYNHVMAAVKKITRHYVDNHGFDGVNILQSNGKAAGQCVFHLHFHLFPRRSGDGANILPAAKADAKELAYVHEKLKM